MADQTSISTDELTRMQARAELPDLIARIEAANAAYHTQDAPEISDAEYDRLKRRLAAIEARFPDLKSADSPSEKVGAALAEGFGKITHAQRMMSLSNAFSDEDVREFDDSIRSFLGLGADAALAYTAEPK
ncbi:MAG: NAD-dependent DNA ligase LigA, partial [Rhodobacteraceae bacterium]|nr:NAD-dependent DNA ligase LigA [Paracoccaceae bacterium]